MKALILLVLLPFVGFAQAQQQPGVNCVPVQGQGWQGCAPIDNNTQQPQRPQPLPQIWADHWGAIATNEPTNSLGVANNMASQSEAKKAALTDCKSKHGSTCKLETSYRNQCGALIGSTTGYVVTSKATLDETVQAGMLTCTQAGYSNCSVYYSACSFPVRIQ
ncbi:DUF4189 domain-containing protein [Rhodanobacter sp. Col0626]|uniref:DUF4189 domain-containing protein n=1 Tax=Rhodanobacter sp. Col0626 TaxID=3415679 RepID=UPI003CFAC13A